MHFIPFDIYNSGNEGYFYWKKIGRGGWQRFNLPKVPRVMTEEYKPNHPINVDMRITWEKKIMHYQLIEIEIISLYVKILNVYWWRCRKWKNLKIGAGRDC